MRKILGSNIKIEVAVAFVLSFTALFIVQFLSDKNIERLKSSFEQINESRQLAAKINTVFTSINSYNSKISLFVLSGNKNFLSGNEENLEEVHIYMDEIRVYAKYVLNDPLNTGKRVLVNQLDSLVKAEINFCQEVLITNNNSNNEEAVTLINTGTGQKLIHDILATTKKIREIELLNLARIIRENESFSKNITELNYAATVFEIIVVLFAIFILYRDINKRIKMEQQLRIAQQDAEQSAIMKEQFMANMSHEIRTPLNAIIGFTNLLSKSKLDEVQRKHVNTIQTSGESLLKIINDILNFSKIEAGMVNIEKVPFNLAALLHSVNVMFLPKANDKKLQLDFYMPNELPEIVIGDPSRLTQILVNLVNNAIKFTDEGSISVKAELVEKQKQSVKVQFTIKDTGIGIPRNKQEEIFERFIQAHADTSRKYGGSGLGLSIVKKLVELQGGYIHVDSAEGVGSSFSFVLPYNISSDPYPVATSPQVPHSLLNKKINILVAEDNALNQSLMETLLSQWGFTYDIVENGKIVIEKLKQSKYDLILMDIQMPEMNGYDTARYIRQELQMNVPVIAMTAHVLQGEKEKCLSFGMNDYISKPIREYELLNLITKYSGVKTQKKIPETKNQNSTNTNQGVINLDYVNELSNGNTDFVAKMIDLFLSENPKEISQLESAILKRDMKAVHAIAHKMNSSVPFVGLNLIIGNELADIEKLAEDKANLPSIETLFSKVKDTCLKAIEELKHLNQNSL